MTASIALFLRHYDARISARAAVALVAAAAVVAPEAPAMRIYRVRKPRVLRPFSVASIVIGLAALVIAALPTAARAQQGGCDELGPRLDGTMVTVCNAHVTRIYRPARPFVRVFVDEIDGRVARVIVGGKDDWRDVVVRTSALPSWAREGSTVYVAADAIPAVVIAKAVR